MENQTEPAVNCRHERVRMEKHASQFFRRNFMAEVARCEDCGQRLWTDTTQRQFVDWILQLKREHRNTFQVQFYLTKLAHDGLAKMRTQFPGVAKSTLIRALTTAYLSTHLRSAAFAEAMRGIVEREAYRNLAFGTRKKTSLQFSPMALLELQAQAPALKLGPHKVVEDAILKILVLREENDRVFWQRELLPQLELILRAV